MAAEYSIETCQNLAQEFQACRLHRPLRISHYDPGTELYYEMTGVVPAGKAKVRLQVEKFVGGGFAGQVYRVRVLQVEAEPDCLPGIQVGSLYAVKILIPPSRFSLLFRNAVYGLGFQGPFQLQVNPAAARAGVLWQKFIRRAARIRFGDESCVVDVLATFIDHPLGSCGEISEWVEGRTWRFEVDDHVDLLKRWKKGHPVDQTKLSSPEYRAKYQFMAGFVKLLHEIGAPEFARQYEWSTCKSQPNCLKRTSTDSTPETGLVAVDFRAGLALLPFLPMSPGDFKLIGKGIARGSLVQFDRGSLEKLKTFIDTHPDDFADMAGAFQELTEAERIYRHSLPDITHNHVRLLYSRSLWATITERAVTGWEVRNLTDEKTTQKLRGNRLAIVLFALLGLIPLLGGFLRKIWGRSDYRQHYSQILTSRDYFRRALRGRMAETLILWHRAGRITSEKAPLLLQHFPRFFGHWLLSFLPLFVHRACTDWQYCKNVFAYIAIRPVKLYFNAELREQWLRDMVLEGQKHHMLTCGDADTILSQLKEPFIQKYLKSLAVHVCTLPVTQLVSVTIAIIYYFTHRQDPNAWAVGLGIIAAFQVIPISPGSLCRGLYVVYLVIREKNFKDYNIAVFLGFFKYIGYLAFPIQMAYRYPVLARFMAGHWATGAVHIVPVFGERGALLEHGVFSLFYNWPLTIRRRMQLQANLRQQQKPCRWHLIPIVLLAAAGIGLAEFLYLKHYEVLLHPHLKEVWWLAVLLPLLTGVSITLGAGGASLSRRVIYAAIGGVSLAFLSAGFHTWLNWTSPVSGENPAAGMILVTFLLAFLWRTFIFGIFSTIGAIGTELKRPEPKSL